MCILAQIHENMDKECSVLHGRVVVFHIIKNVHLEMYIPFLFE